MQPTENTKEGSARLIISKDDRKDFAKTIENNSVQNAVIAQTKWLGKDAVWLLYGILDHCEDKVMFIQRLIVTEESIVSCKNKLLLFILWGTGALYTE